MHVLSPGNKMNVSFKCSASIEFAVWGLEAPLPPPPAVPENKIMGWDKFDVKEIEFCIWSEGDNDMSQCKLSSNIKNPTNVTCTTNCDTLNMQTFLADGRISVCSITISIAKIMDLFKIGEPTFRHYDNWEEIPVEKILYMFHPVDNNVRVCLLMSNIQFGGWSINDLRPTTLGDEQHFVRRGKMYESLREKRGENAERLFDQSRKNLEEVFPEETCGTNFVCLHTCLPVSVANKSFDDKSPAEGNRCDRNNVQISMAHLQKTLYGRGKSLSVPVMAYLFHASYLFNNLNQWDRWENLPLATKFKVLTHMQRLFTSNAHMDRYDGDKVPIGVQKWLTLDNQMTEFYMLYDTEDIRCPLNKKCKKPQDCEDTAMLQLMVTLACNENLEDVEELLRQRESYIRQELVGLKKLSATTREMLLENLLGLCKNVRDGTFTSCLLTVTAGDACVSDGKMRVNGEGCGHECSMTLGWDEQEKEYSEVALMEGTYWTLNSTTMEPGDIQELNDLTRKVVTCLDECKYTGEIRPLKVSQVGFRDQSDGLECGSIGFYRCVWSIRDYVLLTVDTKNKTLKRWGASLDDLIASFSKKQSERVEKQENETILFKKLTGAGVFNDKEWEEEEKYLKGLSRCTQMPCMGSDDWKKWMAKWLELPEEVNMGIDTDKHVLISVNEGISKEIRGKMAGKNVYISDEFIPFMDWRLYQCRSKPPPPQK